MSSVDDCPERESLIGKQSRVGGYNHMVIAQIMYCLFKLSRKNTGESSSDVSFSFRTLESLSLTCQYTTTKTDQKNTRINT